MTTANAESTLKPLSSGRLALRTAAVFGVVGTLGFVLFAILGRNDPLRLPDLCMIGMIFAAPAAVGAAIYTMFETIVRRPIVVDFLYFSMLTFWSLTCWLHDIVSPVEKGLWIFVAAGSMVAGTIGWPMCRFRVPRVFAVGAAVAGGGLLALYVAVAR